jgi:hypothetical protein
MPINHVEILVEEASMEEVLRVLVPKIVGPVNCNFQRFEGKRALLRQLSSRLRGLRRMIQSDWLILVVVDRDRDDCLMLKAQLESEAHAVDLATRSSRHSGPFAVVNRIAVEELEAWYFGDWPAVMAAYPRVSPSTPSRAAYRVPDAIMGGTWEAFERVMKQGGYFRTGLPKIEVAQQIAPHMDPSRNTSRSFQVLRDGLREAART